MEKRPESQITILAAESAQEYKNLQLKLTFILKWQLYILLCLKNRVKVYFGDFAGVCTNICVRNILDG